MMIANIVDDPVIPIWWGLNEPGMQAFTEADPEKREQGIKIWLSARDQAVTHAKQLAELGFHKQIGNRLIEPFMWITVIMSATTWSNFFGLRMHKAAEPHFQRLAGEMQKQMNASKPVSIAAGRWHMPLIYQEDWDLAAQYLGFKGLSDIEAHYGSQEQTLDELEKLLVRISVGRCARVSYLTHEGKRDLKKDIELCDDLMVKEPLHASPGEHVAMAMQDDCRIGNFQGWKQMRKFQKNEHIGEAMP